MRKKRDHFQKTHAVQSWLNLLLSVLLVACVFVSVVIKLLASPTELVQEVGIKTFRMFTVLSNIFVGITASMSIPFAVDGIREENYHLPLWIIHLTYVSVTCICLTFTISLCILSPGAGFVTMMASGTNLLMHTVVPLIAILSFLFINTYHTVRIKAVLYAMLPVMAYATVYLISAILVGEEKGGWRDHYHFQELMPWYYVLPLMLLVTFGLAMLLRAGHNRMHRRDKAATAFYYQNAAEYDMPTIREAIEKLAAEHRENDTGGEVVVPRRIIAMLEKKYASQKPMSELCGIYLNEYLK